MKVETSLGINLDVPEEAFDDFKVVEALADLEDGNSLAIARLCRLLFTKEQMKEIYSAIEKQNNGKRPVTAFTTFIVEVMTGLKDGKKS